MALAIHKNALAKRMRRPAHRSGRVVTDRVHDDAWSLALILADGQRLRLRVISATAVIVQNGRRRAT